MLGFGASYIRDLTVYALEDDLSRTFVETYISLTDLDYRFILIKPSGAETRIFWVNYGNNMPADALVS